MTLSMMVVLTVTALAIIFFITEWIRYDIVGLIVLLSLALTGIITHDQALQGFSNPAVITIASILVLSGGLSRTGVANVVGRHVLKLAGDSQARLIFLMMGTAGLLSGIMNNIAVTALLLPVVLDTARKTGQAPSKLLIPLAFGSLLGGQMTLIGTAPNILIAGFVENANLTPFRMFDFTPVGSAVLAAGILYMVILGRRLLRSRESGVPVRPRSVNIHAAYDLQNTVFTVTIPQNSPLAGLSLAECRIGVALGLNVLAIRRNREHYLAPEPSFVLRGGDHLVMQGRMEALKALRSWKPLVRQDKRLLMTDDLISESIGLAEVHVVAGSTICGCTLAEIDLRTRFGVTAIAIARGDTLRRTRLKEIKLQEGDVLLVMGSVEKIQSLSDQEDFGGFRSLSSREADESYQLCKRLMRLRVPADSPLAGRTLAESRLGDALGITILEVRKGSDTVRLPSPDMVLEVGNDLLIAGRDAELHLLDAFQSLEIRREPPEVEELESDRIGFAEATLAPRTSLIGKTLQDLYFREKYGLTVISIWRGNRSYHSNVRVRSMKLRLGDALLVYGSRERLAMLARDSDFLVLVDEAREILRESKMFVASGIMAVMILSVAFKLLPIHIAAPLGAVLMVLSGCLTLEEAYSFIEWKVLILIAGMLGLGLAMQESGSATLIASNVIGTMGQFGPLAVVAGLFLITALSAQIMPTAAVAVLMSPIALSVAADLSLSPHALMMVVAVSSSCAFLSPVGHPANLLVMGLGGYKFTDYTKVGLGLFLALLAVVLLVLPLVWPLIV